MLKVSKNCSTVGSFLYVDEMTVIVSARFTDDAEKILQ
jgi:hypothetical protein